MSTALATIDFGPEQIELLKNTICKGATNDEFAMFMGVCKRTGLDPFARQIYAVKRPNKKAGRDDMTIQVSIDGFRLIADRTGKYAGQVGPQWCGDDGVWVDVWTNSDKPPTASRVGVLRSDFQQPVWGVARFDAYAQRTYEGNLVSMWSKMGDNMIAKCAEAQALRKAFPQDLSGLYTSDEMEQASVADTEQSAVPPRVEVARKALEAAPASKPKVELAKEIADWSGMSAKDPTFAGVCAKIIAKASGGKFPAKVSDEQAAIVLNWVRSEREKGTDFAAAYNPEQVAA